MSADIHSMPFEELLERYSYLIERYSHEHLRGCSPVMDADDFRQELRLVLWRAQQNFRARSRFSSSSRTRTSLEFWFIGYLARAMANQARKKAYQLTGVRKRVPPSQTSSLETMMEAGATLPFAEDERDDTDLDAWVKELSPTALRLVHLALLGCYSKRDLVRASGLPTQQVRDALEELRQRAGLLVDSSRLP